MKVNPSDISVRRMVNIRICPISLDRTKSEFQYKEPPEYFTFLLSASRDGLDRVSLLRSAEKCFIMQSVYVQTSKC